MCPCQTTATTAAAFDQHWRIEASCGERSASDLSGLSSSPVTTQPLNLEGKEIENNSSFGFCQCRGAEKSSGQVQDTKRGNTYIRSGKGRMSGRLVVQIVIVWKYTAQTWQPWNTRDFGSHCQSDKSQTTRQNLTMG